MALAGSGGMRTVELALLLAALPLAACRSTPTSRDPASHAEVHRDAETVTHIESETNDRTYALECTAPQDRERCGLVHDRLFRPNTFHRFVRKVCREDPTRPSEECETRRLQMFLAILSARYVEVTPELLEQHCDAQPRACEDLRAVEQWMMRQHNEAVLTNYRAAEAQADDEALAEQRAVQSQRRHDAIISIIATHQER